MQKAYTLREPYKDTFVGGHVTTGIEGRGVNLQDLLKEGDGEIITDDAVFQSVLENYFGADGLVFDAHQVSGDERIPVPIAGTAPPIAVVGNAMPGPLPPSTPVAPGVGTAAAVPEAQHGEESESEYAKMPVSELREVVRERDIQNPGIGNAKKDELIAMLEADDMHRSQNPQ